MERRTQMNGVRLGFTYAAALVLIGLLVAAIAAPSPGHGKPAPSNAKPLPPGFFRFTAVKIPPAKAPPVSKPIRRPG
jgi:hypothetical protein